VTVESPSSYHGRGWGGHLIVSLLHAPQAGQGFEGEPAQQRPAKKISSQNLLLQDEFYDITGTLSDTDHLFTTTWYF
jgi:hypothetical protein